MRVLLCLVALAAIGCGDTIIQPPTYPAPVPSPSTPTPPARSHPIEFRVNGNATSARIRYSDPIDGLTQVVSGLPYVVETATLQSALFLSLDVTPIAFPFAVQAPFLSAQILVDGALFREATASDTVLNTLSVNGTWRSN